MADAESGALDIPEIMTVVENMSDLDWKWHEILAVALGAGIPLVIWKLGGGDQETPTSVGAVEVANVRRLVNAGVIRFDSPTEPRIMATYAPHPIDPGRYLPVESYHRTILTEKVSQGARLLLALGATKVEAAYRVATGSGATGSGRVEAADLAGLDLGVDLDFENASEDTWQAIISGASGARRPLPELSWLGHDTMFQVAIDAADSGAGLVHLKLASSDTTTVGAGLIGRLKDVGVKFSGKYKRWEDVQLRFRATFHD